MISFSNHNPNLENIWSMLKGLMIFGSLPYICTMSFFMDVFEGLQANIHTNTTLRGNNLGNIRY